MAYWPDPACGAIGCCRWSWRALSVSAPSRKDLPWSQATPNHAHISTSPSPPCPTSPCRPKLQCGHSPQLLQSCAGAGHLPANSMLQPGGRGLGRIGSFQLPSSATFPHQSETLYVLQPGSIGLEKSVVAQVQHPTAWPWHRCREIPLPLMCCQSPPAHIKLKLGCSGSQLVKMPALGLTYCSNFLFCPVIQPQS